MNMLIKLFNFKWLFNKIVNYFAMILFKKHDLVEKIAIFSKECPILITIFIFLKMFKIV